MVLKSPKLDGDKLTFDVKLLGGGPRIPTRCMRVRLLPLSALLLTGPA